MEFAQSAMNRKIRTIDCLGRVKYMKKIRKLNSKWEDSFSIRGRYSSHCGITVESVKGSYAFGHIHKIVTDLRVQSMAENKGSNCKISSGWGETIRPSQRVWAINFLEFYDWLEIVPNIKAFLVYSWRDKFNTVFIFIARFWIWIFCLLFCFEIVSFCIALAVLNLAL